MKSKIFNMTIFLMVLTMLISSCSSIAVLLPRQKMNTTPLLPKSNAQATTNSSTTEGNNSTSAVSDQAKGAAISESGVIAAYEGTLESVYNEVNPSVVNIRVVKKQTESPMNFGQLPEIPFFNIPGFPSSPDNSQPSTPQYSQALGSGFVWDTQGHIITNNHVIDGADKIEVTFFDDTTRSATVVGADKDSDLAVLKVDMPADQLRPVTIADSETIKVGELAIAIGNPYGLEGTMTVGIISGLDRSLAVEGNSLNGANYSIPDIIQTDAPINPGNSGGVLVNDQAQVMGVTAAIESNDGSNAGIGFVIPSALVQKIVPTLIKTGTFKHPYLGISGMTLTSDLATAMNLDPNQRGALVEEVVTGSPADKAGVRGSDHKITIDGEEVTVGGDVIVAIENQPIKSMDEMIAYLADHTEVGQKVTLSVLRNGKKTTLDVTLNARPSQQSQSKQTTVENSVWLGITGVPLTTEIAKSLNLPDDQKGILIQGVEANSPADKAGLQGGYKPITIGGQRIVIGGDVILAVNGQNVSSIDELIQQLGQYQAGKLVTLTIIRGGEKIDAAVTLEQQPQ